MVKRPQKLASKTDLFLWAAKIRRENMVAQYKTAKEASDLQRRIKASENITNLRHQYNNLLEQHSRTPVVFQGEIMARLATLKAAKDRLGVQLQHESTYLMPRMNYY